MPSIPIHSGIARGRLSSPGRSVPTTVTARIAELSRRLAAVGIEAPRSEAWLLAAAATGRERASLIAGGLEHLTAEQERRLEDMVARRLAREPIAYVLGEKEFWSLPFRVSPAVLIPRPETETVVEAALAQISRRERAAPAPRPRHRLRLSLARALVGVAAGDRARHRSLRRRLWRWRGSTPST